MRSVQDNIQKQLETNKSKNLLYIDAAQVMEIEPGFLNTLDEMLASAKQNSSLTREIPYDLVSLSAQLFIEKLYAINQYLRIDPGKLEELEEIYRQSWQKMLETGDIQGTLRAFHYPRLSRWIETLYPDQFLEQLKFTPRVGTVVCEEYSAQFQIGILGIDLEHIKEPVLDIGCGREGRLVRYLRSLGIEVHGFDRSLALQESYLQKKDWFDYPFEANTWGTIISNMAFTNHLLFAYRHDQAQFEQYLLKTREIITSLAVGGSFYYAPGLPFIERLLNPAQYKLDRNQVIGDVFVSVLTRIVNT